MVLMGKFSHRLPAGHRMMLLKMICVFVHHRNDADVGATLLAIRTANNLQVEDRAMQRLIHKLMKLVLRNKYTYVTKFMQDAQ